MQKSVAFDQLRRVSAELAAVRYSLEIVSENWHEHVAKVATEESKFAIGDVRRSMINSDATYILRLFATFESVLRDYWTTGLGRRTDPDIRPLINSVARRRNMDPVTLAKAHDIRDFRNHIMHRDERAPRLKFAECSKSLGSYLSWLPQQW